MNKKLISLLVAICLVVSLLPAVTVATVAAPATAGVNLMYGSTHALRLTATKDGAATYTKNVENAFTIDGVEGAFGWAQEICTVNDEATDVWNTKFYYDAEADKYTLVLNGAKMVTLHEGTTYATCSYAIGGTEGKDSDYFDMNIVIKADSYIDLNGSAIKSRYNGANRWQSLTITSEGDAILDATCYKADGVNTQCDVTIDANLDIYNYGCYCFNVSTVSGTTNPVTINGGNVTLYNKYTSGTLGYCFFVPDDVYINGGTISAEVSLNKRGVFASSKSGGAADTAVVVADNVCYKALKADGTTKVDVATETVSGAVVKTWDSYGEHTLGEAVEGVATCSVCGAEVTVPCKHTNTTTDEVIDDPGDCNSDGSKTVTTTCVDCGETISTQNVPIIAPGHTYTDGTDVECDVCGDVRCLHTTTTPNEVVDPATCVNPGSKTVTTTCDDCGETISTNTEPIPATGVHTAARTEVEVLDPATADKEGKKRVTEYCACGLELGTREEPIPIPVVEMEAAAADTTKPTMPATAPESAKVTLWGTEVSIDSDAATAEIPEALYWVNGADGENPVATNATGNWNISFQIIDNVPTVTLKNAKYNGTETFLSATYDGCLRLVYEGTNDIVVPYNTTSKTYRYFLYYSAATNEAGKGNLFIEGAENAVLNVTGGDNDASMLAVSNKAYLTIYGGTINMEKAVDNGGVNALIGAGYSQTLIQDCTLNVKNLSNVSGKHPAITVGGSKSLTVTNAKINIETNAYTGLCVGVFQSNMKGVRYAGSMTVNGSSNIKIVTNSNASRTEPYSGVGIYASTLNIKNGSLEVEGNTKAVHLTSSGATPNLADYTGQYKMFTAKYSADVTEYTETTYFRVACCTPPCLHTNTTTNEVINPATCVNPGSKTVATTCDDCGKPLGTNTEPIPATGVHTVARTEVEILDPATADKEGKKRVTEYCACGLELDTREEPIPIPLVEMNAPAVDTTKPTMPEAAPESAKVTLWGTEVTVDATNTAYYWVNGADGELPAAATATDNWNISFQIIDNIPTVTLRDVKYNGANTFLYAKYDGNLRVVYEGTNDIVVPYNETKDEKRYFISYSAETNTAGEGKLFIEGTENAVLNVTGGDNDASMLSVGNKAYLTIYGGTINMEKAVDNGGANALIGAGYSKTVIQDCTLNVKNLSNASSKHPAITVGGSKSLTVTNAKISIETNAYTGLCVGVFQSNMKGVLYAGTMTVDGSSNIKIVTNSNASRTEPYSGVGIYAKSLKVNNGNLEVEGNTKAVHLTSSDATPELLDYAGRYKMFTAKDSADVTEYTATPYFRIAYTGESLNYKLKIQETHYKLMDYETPIYLINTTATGYFNKTKKIDVTDPTTGEPVLNDKGEVKTETVVEESETRPYKTQTTEGANESNYNAKLVWHEGDEGPTLYLRDFVINDYNEELGRWRYKSATDTSSLKNTAITTDAKAPLNIVLTGKDSYFECRFGIHYNNDLNIKSVGDAKLTMNNQSSNISSVDATGYTLTVDANLDLYIRSLYSSSYSGGSIMNKGDIIINGGNIVTNNGVDNKRDVNSIVARGEGANLTINGGNITGVGSNGAGHRNGALQANGVLTINGGVVNMTAKKAVGLYGQGGIEINGGEINVMSPWFGITAGVTVDGKVQTKPIHINGGTLTVLAKNAFYTGEALYIGEGVMAYAGAGKRIAEIFDGTSAKLAKKPWFFATDDESKFLVIDEDIEDNESILDAPTAPTTADGTGAPSDATGGPGTPDSTGATTPGGENPDQNTPEGETPEVEYWDSNIYIDYVEGDMDVIPDTLIEIGLDSADAIWNALLEMMWNVDEYINRVSFFDAVPWFYNGEEWVFAEESDLPEDGYVTVVLPYPEGTDMDTEFTALHMFTTDTFGMIPGDVELLLPVNTEEGIVLELIGLSPVMLGWIDYDAEDEINPPTGDTGVGLYVALMVVAVLGMAGTVMLSNNKKKRKVS